MIDNSSITEIISTTKSLSSKGKALINAANVAGGKDNITVVMVQNNKPPLKHTATKPVMQLKKKDDVTNDEAVTVASDVPTPPTITETRKKRSIVPLLAFLCVLLLGAFLWVVYQGYYNRKVHQEQVKNSVEVKVRNDKEQLLVDSINGTQTREVFVLNQLDAPPIIISDSILIGKDSLHIIGNGVTLLADTAYKGPALVASSSSSYLLLDSLTLENFDIGVVMKTRGLHLKNVQFKNCRIPVQYNFLFPERPVINGRFADTVFYNSDLTQNNY
jgi:hypothetical protein